MRSKIWTSNDFISENKTFFLLPCFLDFLAFYELEMLIVMDVAYPDTHKIRFNLIVPKWGYLSFMWFTVPYLILGTFLTSKQRLFEVRPFIQWFHLLPSKIQEKKIVNICYYYNNTHVAYSQTVDVFFPYSRISGKYFWFQIEKRILNHYFK